jgi:2'-5' RNA ligase
MRPNWFIALPVPAAHWFAERVAQHPPPSVRLFHPDDVHLTVAFLGGVTEDAARRAWQRADLWQQGPMQVTFGDVIGMGAPAHFTALSALLERGRAEAEEGMRACRDPMLLAAGAPPERRAIKAHVTIARPRRNASLHERSACLAWALHLPLRDVEVELGEIALYTWPEDRRDRQFMIAERRGLRPLPSAA